MAPRAGDTVRWVSQAMLVVAAPFYLGGCFTAFRTAKMVDGASVTVGVQRYGFEDDDDDSHFLVVFPRAGRPAETGRLGWEVGARFVTDVLSNPEGREAGWMWSVEPRMQFPKNRIVDVALGMDTYFIYPANVSLTVSRDLGPWLTPYVEHKAMWVLWSLTHGERVNRYAPRMVYGVAITPFRYGRLYVETEVDYTEFEDPQPRLAVGVELLPVMKKKDGSPPPPPRRKTRGVW